MKPLTAVVILISPLVTACVNDALAPQPGPLQLEAAIARSTLGIGDTASIVFRLRNLTSDSIVLNFNDSCQILPYITTRHADQVVHPSGGDWGCYQVVMSLTLAPEAAETLTVLVRGGALATGPGGLRQDRHPAIPLLPGEYLAFARLEHPDFLLRSPMLAIRVQ